MSRNVKNHSSCSVKVFDVQRWMHCILAIGFVIVAIGMPVAARADVGVPPWALQPAALSHGEGATRVAMVHEDVLITIEEEESDDVFLYSNERYAASKLISRVEAVFQMRNTGDSAESFDVWFPLWLPYYPWGAQVVPVQNFQVWVDGIQVSFHTVDMSETTGMDIVENQPWAVWPMQFPPGENVDIRVVYDCYPTGELPYATFQYILETGADWAGAIGSGQVTFALPFDVDDMNVILPDGDVAIDGNEVVLSFENLEPTEEDNVSLSMLDPDVWQSVEAAQNAMDDNPESVRSLLDYADVAMDAITVRKGYSSSNGLSGVYATEVQRAFEAAYAIDPDAFTVHDATGYLLLLSYQSLHESWAPPEDLLDTLSSALEREPEAYAEVVSYLEMLSLKWDREFWLEEDGTEHAPEPPSEHLLMLVLQVDSISPEPLEHLSTWVTMAHEALPDYTPIEYPTETALPEPQPTPVPATVEAEDPPDDAPLVEPGSRLCAGAVSLVFLPLAVYTLSWRRDKDRSKAGIMTD